MTTSSEQLQFIEILKNANKLAKEIDNVTNGQKTHIIALALAAFDRGMLTSYGNEWIREKHYARKYMESN